jgi:hypothetical protein
MLTETVALAVVGGAIGIPVATIAAQVLSNWQLPIAFPVQIDVQPDSRVFASIFLLTLVAGLAFGFAPARLAARTDLNTALRSADGTHKGRWPVRELLVGVQIALCVLLVTTCLASVRSLDRFLTMPIGLEPRDLVLASIDLGLAGYEREPGESLRRQALDRMSALPGVENAAFANSLPLSSDLSTSNIYVDDDTTPATSELPLARKYEVSPGFFAALKTKMVAGRDFEWRTMPTRPASRW